MADIIIPVYKPDKKFDRLLEQLFLQTVRPERIILMNTVTEDFTTKDLERRVQRIANRCDRKGVDAVAVELHSIKKEEFNHGGTRRLAAEFVQSDIFVCMTQDAIPADVFLLEKLLKPFKNPSIGASYGRQLASERANFTERYSRLFNYPSESLVKSKADLDTLGVKTYFCSNACAAYRKSVYEEVGGFIEHTIFNEDMILAAGIIQADYQIAYQAEAKVYHTHNYNFVQQFRRNFDLAVSQADNPEVFKKVKSESEGMRYIKEALEYCMSQERYLDAATVVFDAAFRYAGYVLGKQYKWLPEKMVLACTMNKTYWESLPQKQGSNSLFQMWKADSECLFCQEKGNDSNKGKIVEKGKQFLVNLLFGAEDDALEKTNEKEDAADVLKELQGYEADALKQFITLCEKHNLRYYVIGGTLLGAVRHGGFIPWDDDVDVAMPRADYDTFLEIAAEELPKPYVIEYPKKDLDFKSYFAKIRRTDITVYEELLENEASSRIGYLIDVIPIDGTPDNAFAKKLYYAQVLGYRFLCGTANVYTGIRTNRPKSEQLLLRVVRALKLYEWIDVQKVYEKMDKLFHKQDCETAKEIGTLMGAYKLHEIVPREYFGDYENASVWQFEDMQVKGPELWDEYLTHMYGDYKTPPKKEDQVLHYQPIIKKEEV